MKGKLLFVAGAAVGYVFGARAGRKRYEQIKSAAQAVWETDGVQNQVQQVQDFAAQRVGEVPGALLNGAKKVFTTVSGLTKDAAPRPDSTDAGSTGAGSTGPESAGSAATTSAKKPAAKKPTARKPAAKKTPPADAEM